MENKEIEAILMELTELLSDGVHIVDMDGVSLVYNSAMEEIEELSRKEVLGKPFSETFGNISAEDSTLRRALANEEKSIKFRQTYETEKGKEITTENTTVPVIVQGKVIAAIEVAKDLSSIKRVTDKMLEYKNAKPKIKSYSFDNFVGESAKFLAVVEKAKLAASTKTAVFIYGETGTGKELFSQSIHYSGERKDKPFVAQNCAAIPDSLFEGILFGTAKGGFTGAVDRAGLFEQANGGTLLLDEVSAMPYDLQSKLLRVLQEGYVRRVGGSKDIPVDVKIIATVNEDPIRLIEEGALRKDLYYRLNIISLVIPPLNERREDIPILVEHFIEKHNKELGRRVEGVSGEAMEKLMAHNFSGNVRELENMIMAAVALSNNEKILSSDHLYVDEVSSVPEKAEVSFDPEKENLSDFLEGIEKDIIEKAMAENGGNVTRVAKKIGMKRQTLQHKLKKYILGPT